MQLSETLQRLRAKRFEAESKWKHMASGTTDQRRRLLREIHDYKKFNSIAMCHNVITIFGATGAQGSSVLYSLAHNTATPFSLRGIIRNPSSTASTSLLKKVPHVELVEADGWNKESMIAAFRGSWGAFVNTDSDDAVFENPHETRREVDLGRIIVDAAVEAGVEVLVYSGVKSAKEITEAKVANRAFDEKNAVGEYAKATGAFKVVVIASPGSYFENFLDQELAPICGGFPYVPSEDGTYVLRLPKWGGKEDIPFIAIGDDYGDIVHGIFLEPARWNGKLVQGVSDIRSWEVLCWLSKKVTSHATTSPFITSNGIVATKKKARFEEGKDWRVFEIYGIRALETVKLIFGFCQESGGRYFGEETEAGTALELKKKVAKACGRLDDDATLLSIEEFMVREFGRDK